MTWDTFLKIGFAMVGCALAGAFLTLMAIIIAFWYELRRSW